MSTLTPQLKPYQWRVQDAYGEFFSKYPWEWFITLTFAGRTHPEAVEASFRTWIAKMNRMLNGSRWHKKETGNIYWVMAIERHKSGNPHVHALLIGTKDLRRLFWMDSWLAMGGKNGFARIEAIKKNESASFYVTKYVTKDAELFFSENLEHYVPELDFDWTGEPFK